MLVSKARLERIPTLKEQVKDLGMDEATTLVRPPRLLGAAEPPTSCSTCRATCRWARTRCRTVELTRELARRFNFIYCQDRAPVLQEPEALLTEFARLRGLDANRMSKSVGNTIQLAEEPEANPAKVRQAYTDPKKARANDPGRPEPDPSDGHPGCVVWSPPQVQPRRRGLDRRALPARRAGVRARQEAPRPGPVGHARPDPRARERWAADPSAVHDVIREGNRRAREVAVATMEAVRERDEARGAAGDLS